MTGFHCQLLGSFLLLTVAGIGPACQLSEKTDCTAGETQTCTCAGNEEGSQVCEADGESWGPCECVGDDDDASPGDDDDATPGDDDATPGDDDDATPGDDDDTTASDDDDDVTDDNDGDGYTEAEGDCNDNDPALNPADVDGDGWSTCAGDCDDFLAAAAPDQEELLGNAIDEDCDGYAMVFEDNFDDCTIGDYIEERMGWSCLAGFCGTSAATCSGDQSLSCCRSYSTNNGSGEAGHQDSAMEGDFGLEMAFFDSTAATAGNFQLIFGDTDDGTHDFHLGYNEIWGTTHYYLDDGTTEVQLHPKSEGWHDLAVTVTYANPELAMVEVCIDGTCGTGTVDTSIDIFFFNEDERAAYIDDVKLFYLP